jgi:predicted nucleotidyltransferase component of viral defense system
MIKPGEIQNKARLAGVRDQQIEKDYVISWILQGLAKHKLLSSEIVFKGGTVLKKAYFDDYRFSEDLDFTLINREIFNEQIFEWFEEIFEYIRETANIPLKIINDNEHKDGGINFYINYVGPLGGIGANKSIKVDISRSEELEFKTIFRNVFCSYSDLEEHQILCYSLEEILVEKLRSIMQRMQARDFYDLWYLLEVHRMEIDLLLNEFKAKCKNKNINHKEFQVKLEQRLPQYKGRWQNSMKNQIKDLPEFEQVERELIRYLRKIEL